MGKLTEGYGPRLGGGCGGRGLYTVNVKRRN